VAAGRAVLADTGPAAPAAASITIATAVSAILKRGMPAPFPSGRDAMKGIPYY